jgi:small subunit ribosomal protein S17|tara:strand:+ start:2165 stop:2428 length:264 start_codon:yes stop_codon:yes gene_type:complete
MEEKNVQKDENKLKHRKRLQGTVVSDKMKDTIVVSVTRYVKHPKYKKFIQSAKRYQAHDAGDKHSVGEKVTIEEVKPISKKKRFIVV